MDERRKLPRYVMGSSGKLTGSGPYAENVSVLVLSLDGALISCANPPKVGEKCKLTIDFEGAEVEVTAEVRSSEKSGSAGLMFVEVDEQSRKRLRQICAGRPLAQTSRPKGGR